MTSLFVLIFNKVLSSGRQKWLELLESISAREEAVAGGVAIAAAFASYLGPYTFKFRREMLTEHWPRCLNERGVKLVVDSSTVYAGVPMVMVDQDDTKRTSPDKEEVPTQADENATQGHATAQNGRTNQCFSLHLLTSLRLSALPLSLPFIVINEVVRLKLLFPTKFQSYTEFARHPGMCPWDFQW